MFKAYFPRILCQKGVNLVLTMKLNVVLITLSSSLTHFMCIALWAISVVSFCSYLIHLLADFHFSEIKSLFYCLSSIKHVVKSLVFDLYKIWPCMLSHDICTGIIKIYGQIMMDFDFQFLIKSRKTAKILN